MLLQQVVRYAGETGRRATWMWILLSHREQIPLTFSWCARVLSLVLRRPGRFCEATGAGCELKVHGCLGRASCRSEARCHLRRERETKRVDRERRTLGGASWAGRRRGMVSLLPLDRLDD